ncbi:MAG: pyruvate dehydrogenase complex dihydrolipoamide acetyltransferase [Sphingomonadaceae bacterium]|nr:pyruvate dehydrogenase complex dihydrolipoamide acetyltransferase [Sphingomonadaceae bacterium]
MPIEIKMPALSPTMEEGQLVKWMVKEGGRVESGDILAEIETDKATMEFEAVDEGLIASIVVPEGPDSVKVGTVIAILVGEDDETADVTAPAQPPEEKGNAKKSTETRRSPEPARDQSASTQPTAQSKEGRIPASPLAKRLAAEKGIDLGGMTGSGPNGRIVKADIEAAQPGTAKPKGTAAEVPVATSAAKPDVVEMTAETRALLDARVPHKVEKLSGMRKTIAKRLSQSMQEAPHIYLTVDVRLDRLMEIRKEMNQSLQKLDIKLSVNDLLIKALGKALMDVPECNVTFAGNELIRYGRADISMAVSIPGGLITPIVTDADGKSISEIATTTKDLATRAKEGKLKPDEYMGGTASISNMGMMGIKQFTAVINPPQSTILAIGAGEKRPWVMPDGNLGIATVMSVTGSFDHRAVDGADGARLMSAFREYVEMPLGMVA